MKPALNKTHLVGYFAVWMLKHCQKSCGICQVMQGMGMDPNVVHDVPLFTCSDISDNCESRAMNGECQLNPDYMNVKVK